MKVVSKTKYEALDNSYAQVSQNQMKKLETLIMQSELKLKIKGYW